MRHAASVVLLALFATASAEYGREMLRKPYVIGQYMFSNGIRAKSVSVLNTNGYLGASLWTRPSRPAQPPPSRDWPKAKPCSAANAPPATRGTFTAP